MHRTSPDANIDLFSIYGWSSAELFVQALRAAGPRATRAGLQAALRGIHKFDASGLLGLLIRRGRGQALAT
jgi:hypothetical protein